MSDHAELLVSYNGELDRRRANQEEYEDLFVPCPGCDGGDAGWCPVCLSTGLVSKATGREWTELEREAA